MKQFVVLRREAASLSLSFVQSQCAVYSHFHASYNDYLRTASLLYICSKYQPEISVFLGMSPLHIPPDGVLSQTSTKTPQEASISLNLDVNEVLFSEHCVCEL
jgi:hypothetical protein